MISAYFIIFLHSTLQVACLRFPKRWLGFAKSCPQKPIQVSTTTLGYLARSQWGRLQGFYIDPKSTKSLQNYPNLISTRLPQDPEHYSPI